MKTIEINGHLRGTLGSKTAKELRREGHVPCVVYGGGENVHFHADERELNKLVYTPDVYLITIKLGDKEVKAVLREAQYHPVSDKTLHMDFIEVVPGKTVALKLPVDLTGNSVGVKNGGVLRRNAKTLYVRGLVETLPDTIAIDITKMKIGATIKVGDLSIPGVEMLEASNRVVVAIKTSRKAVSETEAEDAEEAAAEGAEGEDAAEEPAEG